MLREDPEAVIRQYADLVYRIAYAQTHRRCDADDLFQEVFLRYCQRKSVFASEEHRKAWLIRVTLNCARKRYAAAWHRRVVLCEPERIPYAQPDETMLDEALSCLSQADQAVLHLYYFESCSTGEIAALLHKRPAAVRARLSRARERLRKSLKGELPCDPVSTNK
jgi:RNA polymerase sigma-70 factor (ECF subfamily)